MAAFMAQSPAIGGLQRRFEGQWLVDDLRDDDRWDGTKPRAYDRIGAVWREAAARAVENQPAIRFFVEKSPPNMVRYREIAALFDRARVVISNRDPYACVSSDGYRRHGFEGLGTAERLTRVEELAGRWLRFGRILKGIAEREGYARTSYEAFCAETAGLFACFGLAGDLAAEADRRHRVRVKDYPAQPVRNMNDEQIAKLSAAEIARIGEVLERDSDEPDFFGYAIRPG